jgi:hypothetical protein
MGDRLGAPLFAQTSVSHPGNVSYLAQTPLCVPVILYSAECVEGATTPNS